jgi:predicted RNase H-like nuclease (RuvC/YqgF family)
MNTPTPRTAAAGFSLVKVYEISQKLERELTIALAEIDRLDVAGIHTCHSECQKSNCVLRRELATITEQRDMLAEALQKLRNNESMSLGGAAYEIVEQALQSLTPNA